ncbi:MAG: transaldolase [Polyangia bacterium]
MQATQALYNVGQSIWLDDITREMLDTGTLARYVAELSVTGLTSNPTIFDKAFLHSRAYDSAIGQKSKEGKTGEALFFALALEDLGRAAELLRAVHQRTHGVDGWVSLEVSPLLAHDTRGTVAAAKALHAQGGIKNLLIKIPGTREGLPAIEEAIFAGVPVNVTLLFSAEQYQSAAEAYLRGIERRIAAGLDPEVGSVASVFVSRWDSAIANRAPAELRNRLGLAVASRVFAAYRANLGADRWQRAYNMGARPQRLLWASTGTKDPAVSDTLYIDALAAPLTVNTMPERTLAAFAEHGKVAPVLADQGEHERILADFSRAGVEVDALAAQLQEEGAGSFVKSWQELLATIAAKLARLSPR